MNQLSDPDKRIHWNVNLNRVRKPLDIYRPWAFDRSGQRRMDANPSDVDCKPPVLGNFDFQSVCLKEPSQLTSYFNIIDNLNALHPRLLLEEFVYRNPDEYLKRKEQGKEACQLGCDGRVYQDPKTMNQREIMRLRFATNNYMTFDDWKDDPEDTLLNEIMDSKNSTTDAKSD